MMKLYYKFADSKTAHAAHEAIDDARCGTGGGWRDGVTERHTTLTRDGADWLVGVTGFTEGQRGTAEAPGPMYDVLPEPTTVDFDTGEKDAEDKPILRVVEKIDPKRTDVLVARRVKVAEAEAEARKFRL